MSIYSLLIKAEPFNGCLALRTRGSRLVFLTAWYVGLLCMFIYAYSQVRFQLYIKARDSDAGLLDLLNGDDDLDDIFVDRTLAVNTSFTGMEEYIGILNRVTLQMRFRVMCQQDYYGEDCSTFCLAENDDVNGHYTCNSDGSIQCQEGFENPSNNNYCNSLLSLWLSMPEL